MMIPLWIFLFLWVGLVAVLSLASLLAATMNFRFGLAGSRTFVMTFFFLALPAAIILATVQYALTVDWSQSLTLFAATGNALY